MTEGFFAAAPYHEPSDPLDRLLGYVKFRGVEAAKRLYAPRARWSAESVSYFIQSVLQGSFVFAKAKQSPEVVRENLAHLKRYLETLFSHPRKLKGANS